MKNIFLLFLLLAPVLSQAQLNFPFKDGKIVYTEIDSNKLTKSVMFKNAQKWIAKTYTKSKLTTENAEAGSIVFKVSETIGDNRFLLYTVEIDVKDHKYRIRLSDIIQRDFYPQQLKESLTPLEDIYNRQLARTDKNKDKGLEYLKGIEDVLKQFLNRAKQAINISDDF